MAFIKPNESNEGERGLSYDCIENQVFVTSGNGESYNNSALEAGNMLSHLEENSSIGGCLGDLRLLLDSWSLFPCIY